MVLFVGCQCYSFTPDMHGSWDFFSLQFQNYEYWRNFISTFSWGGIFYLFFNATGLMNNWKKQLYCQMSLHNQMSPQIVVFLAASQHVLYISSVAPVAYTWFCPLTQAMTERSQFVTHKSACRKGNLAKFRNLNLEIHLISLPYSFRAAGDSSI